MEDLILGLFIGIPVALVIAAIIAYARSNREIQLESAETEEV
jgi:predicted PurR-regulated permease PerM